MRLHWLIFCITLPWLCGCARFPETPVADTVPARTLLSTITVAGEINPVYYYFFAINTDGDPARGPIPIVVGIEFGNGWGTLDNLGPDEPLVQPPFWVQYHNGVFEQYRNGQPIGPPYRAGVSQDRKQLVVEIDQADLGVPTPNLLTVNWITTTEIATAPQSWLTKEYDGFGRSGNNYLEVSPNTARIWESGVGVVPAEEPGTTTDVADINLVGWSVEVKIRE
jgi:hypothetical protein